MLDERKEEAFCTILREELQLATGCTEPIAVAYCAARLRQVLGRKFGMRLAGRAQILGGAILIFIGLEIFISSML